jgi:hypothetical protein
VSTYGATASGVGLLSAIPRRDTMGLKTRTYIPQKFAIASHVDQTDIGSAAPTAGRPANADMFCHTCKLRRGILRVGRCQTLDH